MSKALDANGWTVFADPPGNVYYVDSSRPNDSGDGLSPATAKKTIEAAQWLVFDRGHGNGDWILLKRGLDYDETLDDVRIRQGASADEPMLYGAYGTGSRPRIRTGASGIYLHHGGHGSAFGHVAFQDLHFVPHTRGPNDNVLGLNVQWCDDLTLHIEDCVFEQYHQQMNLTGDLVNVQIRRNIFRDAWGNDSAGGSGDFSNHQGIVMENVAGCLIEGNVFDKMGGQFGGQGSVATIYDHSIYSWATTTGLVVRRNLFSRNGGHAMNFPGGGVLDNYENVYVNNLAGLIAAIGNGTADYRIWGNVFVNWGSVGIEVEGAIDGLIENNLFAHATGVYSVRFSNKSGGQIDAMLVRNNVQYNCRCPFADFRDEGAGAMVGTVRDNTIQEPNLDQGDDPSQLQNGFNSTSLADATFIDNTYFRGGDDTKYFYDGSNFRTRAQWTSERESGATEQEIDFPDPTRDAAAAYAHVGLDIDDFRNRVVGDTATIDAIEAMRQFLLNGYGMGEGGDPISVDLPSLTITTTPQAPTITAGSATTVGLPSLTVTSAPSAPAITVGSIIDLPSLTLSTVLGDPRATIHRPQPCLVGSRFFIGSVAT